jgi:GcrA cell cycle regulator
MPSPPGFRWPDEHVKRLRELASAGISYGYIARILNHEFKTTYTRNAAIGRAKRAGMLGHRRREASDIRAASAIAAKIAARNRREAKKALRKGPPEKPEPLPTQQIYDVARIKFDDLDHRHCKWGVGDPKDPAFGFCGLARVNGSPYCGPHKHRAHDQPMPDLPPTMPYKLQRMDAQFPVNVQQLEPVE